jgi:hypothetical protein
MTISKCRGCKADIIWIKTEKGKSIPIDAKPIKAYSRGLHLYILEDVHLPHWSTCPDAEQFRKIKK